MDNIGGVILRCFQHDPKWSSGIGERERPVRSACVVVFSNCSSCSLLFLHQVLDLSGIISIAEQIKAELTEFKPNLPLITALRNPGMRDRHWSSISELAMKISSTPDTELKIHPDEKQHFNLDSFLKLDLISQLEEIDVIGDKAGKEFSLEKSLARMKQEWEPVGEIMGVGRAMPRI